VTEFIAYQIPEVQEALAHPLTGIASKCKYLPTIADLKEFIEDRAKRHQIRSTVYKYFGANHYDPPMEPAEKRKAQVLAELGYDPSLPHAVKRPPIEPAILDAIAEGTWSSKHLKTPARPPSPELKALLIEQGYLPRPRTDEKGEAA
jgi:hypothetical protein